MAEGDAIVMNNFKEGLLLGLYDLDTDALKVALYSAALGSPDGAPAYTTTNEIVATGYTAGGNAVSTPAVTQDDTNDRAVLDDDGSNITWSNLATATILAARLYDDTASPKDVILEWEIATNSNGGNYTLTFHATNGILTVS